MFNDDKRTDLIGETWIDLRDIIVQGGGQGDQWHTLNCKGKYAGEIRIETTYYDLRPKPEKPVATKPKPMASSSETDLVNGTHKPPIKRRPLPSDPVTGKSPSSAVRDDLQTPPRHKPSGPAAYPPKQSPLQSIEYNTPPTNRFSRSQTDLHAHPPAESNQYATPPPPRQEYHHHPRSSERGDRYLPSPYEEQQPQPQPQYHPDARPHYEINPQRSYHNMHEHYESPPPVRHQPQLPEDDGPPPPPPVHRVRNSIGTSQEIVPRGSYDMAQNKVTPPMRHDVLRNEAHRLSISSPSPAYPGRPTYRPYESAPDVQAPAPPQSNTETNMIAAPRHHSYDSAYDPHYRSMQPTVEDVPESWTPPKARTSLSSQEQFDERDYQLVPTTAPLNMNGQRRDVSDHYNSPVPVQSRGRSDSSGYGPIPPGHARDYSHPEDVPSHPYAPQNNRYIEYPSELDNTQTQPADRFAMVPVPATLIPGVDPSRVRETPDRSYEERPSERRYTHTQPGPVQIQTRGRQHSEPPTSSYAAHYAAQTYANQMNASANYEQSLVRYGSVPINPPAPQPTSRARGVSPNPNANHTIKRKSVSPAPPPPDTRNDGRRLSGVPFGPDSYDELNPALAAAKDPDTNPHDYTNPNGKIVTSDGREVDPSDHLPMDTWAPEPEPKKPSPAPENSRSRPALSGAQPMPPSGRRPLRVTVRPQSAIAAPPQPYATQEATPSPPVSSGRNRLQKKQHRMSAAPAPMSSGHDPLGPVTAHQRNSTPPRALVRASTFDYENYAPPSYGAPRSGHGNGPPIPAKVPMMSGGMGPVDSQEPRGSEEWALMEEMSRIDIGTGRARRRLAYHH